MSESGIMSYSQYRSSINYTSELIDDNENYSLFKAIKNRLFP